MFAGLVTSEAGLLAEGRRMAALADDVANVNTTAFKQTFSSAVDVKPVAGPVTDVYSGGGAVGSATRRDWSQGTLMATQKTWDLGIEGRGLFRLRRPDGSTAFTRNGSFSLNARGVLVDQFGDRVLSTAGSPIQVPPGTTGARPTVNPDGTVVVDGKKVAQIGLAVFRNPEGLSPGPSATWQPTPGSGLPRMVQAGSAGVGRIQQGFLEGSNTDMALVLGNVISANRAFGLDAAAVSAASHMWQLANQIGA